MMTGVVYLIACRQSKPAINGPARDIHQDLRCGSKACGEAVVQRALQVCASNAATSFFVEDMDSVDPASIYGLSYDPSPRSQADDSLYDIGAIFSADEPVLTSIPDATAVARHPVRIAVPAAALFVPGNIVVFACLQGGRYYLTPKLSDQGVHQGFLRLRRLCRSELYPCLRIAI